MTPASRYKELGLYYKQVKSYLDGIRNIHIIVYDDYKNDFQSEMNKIFDFLKIKRVEIDPQHKYMVGGWQWKNENIRKLMIKKNWVRSFLKLLIPFKGIRKNIRARIQSRNSSTVSEMSKADKEMLQAFYKDDIQHLSVLLERDLNYWAK